MSDPEITMSPLCQEVKRDGKAVCVDIYDDGQGGWLLEVIDEYGNSTVWDDSFETDEQAFAECMNTIDEEGIDALIGDDPSTSSKASNVINLH